MWIFSIRTTKVWVLTKLLMLYAILTLIILKMFLCSLTLTVTLLSVWSVQEPVELTTDPTSSCTDIVEINNQGCICFSKKSYSFPPSPFLNQISYILGENIFFPIKYKSLINFFLSLFTLFFSIFHFFLFPFILLLPPPPRLKWKIHNHVSNFFWVQQQFSIGPIFLFLTKNSNRFEDWLTDKPTVLSA